MPLPQSRADGNCLFAADDSGFEEQSEAIAQAALSPGDAAVFRKAVLS